MKQNPNQPFELNPILPESDNQRGFFEGCICQMMTYYQEGMDHRNYKDVQKVREWLKIEFNGEIIDIAGKPHRIAKSTKNKLNMGFLERCIDYMKENYAIPDEAIDPKKYKHWKDTVYPFGKHDTYIDYLKDLNIL